MKIGKITVVIPVKDRFNLLELALKSINNQTLLPKQVIIIDDASSRKIQLKNKYKFNYKILRNKKNIGVSASRNIGIKLCKTKYVAFLDTDDIWFKTKLRLQYDLAEKRKLNFVYCNYKNKKNRKYKIEDNKEIYKRLINFWSNPNCSSMFFKTRSLKKIGCFDVNLRGSEDHDLWFRVSMSNLRVNYLNKVLVKTEKFNYLQISRNYNLRKQSLSYFFKKYERIIPQNKYFKFKKQIYTKAYIPVLNGAIKRFEIFTALKCLKYLIFSKLFYRRYLMFLIRNFFN